MLEVARTEAPEVIPVDGLRMAVGGMTGPVDASRVEVNVITLKRQPKLQSLVSGEIPAAQIEPGYSKWLSDHFIEPHSGSIAGRPETAESSAAFALMLVGAGRGTEAIAAVRPWTGKQHFWADYAEGQAHESLGDASRAEEIYRSMVERNPGDRRAAGVLGRFLMLKQRFAEAALVLEPLATEGTPSALNDFAAAQLGLGRWKAAVRTLRACLREDARNVLAHNNLGLSFMKLNERQRAREHFMAALSIDPTCVAALANLAELHIEDGAFEEALVLLERAPSNDVAAVERQGWCWLKLNNPARARRLLAKTVALTRDSDPIPITNLGAVALATNDVAEAERRFRQAWLLAPENSICALNLARVLGGLGRPKESISILERWETSIEKASPELAMFFANSLSRVGELGRARMVLERGVEAFPHAGGLWANLGFLLMSRLDSLERAIDVMQRGLVAAPVDLLLRNNLAYALLKDGRASDARALLEDIVPKLQLVSDPVVPCLFATWGLLLIREGAFEEGKRFYEQAHQLAPPGLKQRIKQKLLIEDARKAIADGREKAAKALLDKALKIGADSELDSEARGLRGNTLRH